MAEILPERRAKFANLFKTIGVLQPKLENADAKTAICKKSLSILNKDTMGLLLALIPI